MGVGAVDYNANYGRTNDRVDKRTETDGKSDFYKAVQDIIDANQLTAKELKEDKDWRDMSDDEWEKLLDGIDDYIDAFKEEIRQLREKQDEAAKKAAMQASPDRRSTAASSAALSVAATGSAGSVEGDADADSGDEKIGQRIWKRRQCPNSRKCS